jgi:hypothetical protein
MLTCSDSPAFEEFGDSVWMEAAGLMVSVNGPDAVTWLLSCTWMVKFAEWRRWAGR